VDLVGSAVRREHRVWGVVMVYVCVWEGGGHCQAELARPLPAPGRRTIAAERWTWARAPPSAVGQEVGVFCAKFSSADKVRAVRSQC
jgi:hypothetical protein